MNYWWVYQGKSFKRASAGGYLWAPHRTKNDRTGYYYWSNVQRVAMGDVIFAHVDKAVVAVLTPLRPAYETLPPDTKDVAWAGTGWKLDVEYQMLPAPIPYAEAYAEINDLTSSTESPFAANGRPNQGYMFHLPEAAGLRMIELVSQRSPSGILQALSAGTTNSDGQTGPTSALSIVAVRVGQSLFRKRLLDLWRGKCAVSGLGVLELLHASHAKPWSMSSDSERLDRFNGFLLGPSYDAAFDKGLISFDDAGKVIVSPLLQPDEAEMIGIKADAELKFVHAAHLPFLDHHRLTVFRAK
jgi:putative restriction endonuclease